jgi:hypothetical protein
MIELPLLRELPVAVQDRVRPNLRPFRLAAGSTVVHENADVPALTFLSAGEIILVDRGRRYQILRAPQVLGLPGALLREPAIDAAEAFTDVEGALLAGPVVHRLLDEEPAFARLVVSVLARDLAECQHELEIQRDTWQGYFRSPNARILEGPYRADPFEMHVLVAEVPPATLRSWLPPGVRPIPGLPPRVLLTVNLFERVYAVPHPETSAVSYTETTPFVPVLGPRGPALYVPELYPDSMMAINIGREIYGFPKRFGRAERHGDRFDLYLGDGLAAQLRWSGTGSLGFGAFGARLLAALTGNNLVPPVTIPFFDAFAAGAGLRLAPAVPVLVHRQIPDTHPGGPEEMRIDELIEIPFHVESLGECRWYEEVSLDGFGPWVLAGATAVAGGSLRMGLRFGQARRQANYLGTPRSSLVGRLVRLIPGTWS